MEITADYARHKSCDSMAGMSAADATPTRSPSVAARKLIDWQAAVQFVVIVLTILVAVLVLSADIRDVRADVRALRAEVKTDMADLRTEVKADIADLRTEVKTDIADLRAEVGSDVADLRADVESMQADLHAIETRLVRIETRLEIDPPPTAPEPPAERR